MKLHTLSPNPGSKHRVKRLGCGESSGGTVRVGFEGGQMPLHRRLPKRGFNNYDYKTKVFGVNVSTLDENFENGTVITEELLRSVGIVNGRYDQVKILGTGDLTKSLTIQIAHVSATAREKIEKAGGTIQSA